MNKLNLTDDIKLDLIALYKHIKIGKYNKFWRKVLNNTSDRMLVEHKLELFNAIKEVKICDDTIDILKDVKMVDNIFSNIYSNPLFTKSEIYTILDKYRTYVDWYHLFYKFDLEFDIKVKYIEEIRHVFISKYRGSSEQADKFFGDIERERKLKQILDNV